MERSRGGESEGEQGARGAMDGSTQPIDLADDCPPETFAQPAPAGIIPDDGGSSVCKHGRQ